MKKSIVLSYSGGLDSTVLLWSLVKEGYYVHCLSVDYGQRHAKELASAHRIVTELGTEIARFHRVMISGNAMLGSSQTSPDVPVPEGHYAEESMKATVVPNRNMVLLSLAGALAVSTKSHNVAYAAHSGDHAIYPDCRPEFATAMANALLLCDFTPVKILRPFLEPEPLSKTDVVRLGHSLGVPFEHTWSCYKGGERHCGKCGTCVERREAFVDSGVQDPTEYE